MVVICLEQGEKLRRQASDAGEKVKSAAKQAEQQGETLLDKAFNVLSDVKDSILGKEDELLRLKRSLLMSILV